MKVEIRKKRQIYQKYGRIYQRDKLKVWVVREAKSHGWKKFGEDGLQHDSNNRIFWYKENERKQEERNKGSAKQNTRIQLKNLNGKKNTQCYILKIWWRKKIASQKYLEELKQMIKLGKISESDGIDLKMME